MWYQNVVVHSFISSQSTYMTDMQTEGRADRQNYDPQDRASIAVSRSKNGMQLILPHSDHSHAADNIFVGQTFILVHWLCL